MTRQKTALLLATAFALATAGVQGAGTVDVSKLPPVAAKSGVTFDKDIKPFVERSCQKCHSGEKPKGKYRVDTRANFLKGGGDGEPVVIGKSAESKVVHFVADLIEDSEMPPKDKRDKYPALSKEEIGLLRAWIDQGAK